MRQGLCSRFCYPFQTTKVDRRHAYHDTSEVDSLALTPAALGSTGHPRSWAVDIVRHGQCSDIASDSCRRWTVERVLIRIRMEGWVKKEGQGVKFWRTEVQHSPHDQCQLSRPRDRRSSRGWLRKSTMLADDKVR
jgi:hypothetical protein